LLARLREFGFKADEARHYFAFFYQLRRAFFFINQLAGTSPSMCRLRCSLWNNIFTHQAQRYESALWDRMEDFSTLLLGETGTGKGAAAAAIGRSGYIPFEPKTARFAESFTRNFIAINLSQFPENLIESELFGHKKGAFTGAVDNHQGILARCVPHGAIFLDEIGDVTVPVQIKLLKVLQERSFSPVGSHVHKPFRGRIIAATNRPLAELRRQGSFRDDFYYRLCSDVIEVPPLRQQLAEDPASLDPLLKSVLQRILGQAEPDQVRDIRSALQQHLPSNYPWPGNVRELQNAISRSVLLAKDGLIEYRHLGLERSPGRSAALLSPGQTVSPPVTAPFPSMETLEKNHIEAALARTGGKIYGPDGAAILLDMKPTTLQSRIKKLAINRRAFLKA